LAQARLVFAPGRDFFTGSLNASSSLVPKYW